MAKIDVISSCVVKTSSNATAATTATSMSRLELTPWDLRLLQIVPIQRGLIFHKPQSQQTLSIQHLINSLSRTLHFFPPLAGRLATTAHDDDCTATFFVDCNNAGAEFTHAVAAAVSVSDIVEPNYIPEIVSSLFPLNDTTNSEGDTKPLLAVQVTELADGLFIGCTANHAVVDGTSFWHFINSWSEISRGLLTISKTPVFERPILPSKESRGNRLPPLMVQDSSQPPLLKRVFHVSRESLAKLKARANSEGGTDKISSFQALSALLWRTITRCHQPKTIIHNPSSREVEYFALLVGARSRTGLPQGYFGNAVYTAAISTSECELLQNGIGYAALQINELVSQQTSEAAIRDFENSDNRAFLGDLNLDLRPFFIIGSPHHNVYGNDFGWGKPVAVRSGKERDVDGRIYIFPAAESDGGGGVDLEVCLATEKLLAMEQDPEFMAALTASSCT